MSRVFLSLFATFACACALLVHNWTVYQKHRPQLTHNKYHYSSKMRSKDYDNYAIKLNYEGADELHRDVSMKNIDCTTILMGPTTTTAKSLDLVQITIPRSMVDITDVDESMVVGQEVTVCNQDQTGAPAVLPPSEGFSPITVISGNAMKGYHYGTTNLMMRITHYLRTLSPQALTYGEDY